MQSKIIRSLPLIFAILLVMTTACNTSGGTTMPVSSTPKQATLTPLAVPPVTATPTASRTPIAAVETESARIIIRHNMGPGNPPKGGKAVYDVDSSGTASEHRAPYGDSYDLNRLERPFSDHMIYVPELDITKFTVASDNDWWYVSIELQGANIGGFNYGVEIDRDHDGFGDFLIWAHPPYTKRWDTVPVQIYRDQNHNTGGFSSGKADAPFVADGYETLIFDGSVGGDDPDMAWVHRGLGASMHFAFKKSWLGTAFMLGVIADAGWKDPGKFDYVDRLPIAEAGSPIKNNPNYPLKALFLVDNTCREAFGFEPTHYEPQGCPVPPTPTPKPKEPPAPPEVTQAACQPPAGTVCRNGWDPANCRCRP